MGASRTVDADPGRYPAAADSRAFAELWISLASLLRSYTAAHGRTKIATLQAVESMCKGPLIADPAAAIGSSDIGLGEIDRQGAL
jgi:NADH-quinone oxidoreductase subunit D